MHDEPVFITHSIRTDFSTMQSTRQLLIEVKDTFPDIQSRP